MGLKLDLLVFGGLALFLISQKDKIASGIGSTGTFVGETLNTGFQNLFNSINPFAQTDYSDDTSKSDPLIEGDPNDPFFKNPEPPVNNPANCECGTKIFQDQLGNVTTTCLECKQNDNFDESKFIPAPEPEPDNGLIPTAYGDDGYQVGDIIPKSEIDKVTQQTVDQQNVNKSNTQTLAPLINDKSVVITGSYGESGVGQQGFIINENPIDTFAEVLKYYPELTSSQARDFLNETGGKLLPSQVEFFDPDIKNIVAAEYGGGMNQAIPVDTTTYPDELKAQEKISACYTCQAYGLNCAICNG